MKYIRRWYNLSDLVRKDSKNSIISLNFLMDNLEKELREEYLKIGKKAKYGTAGFRDLATNIPYVYFFSLRSAIKLVPLLLS